MSGTRNLEGLKTQMLECIDAAYDKGYKAAKQDVVVAGNKSEYERGLNDAWDCARRIYEMPCDVVCELFPYSGDVIFADVTASKAIEKIREYEDRQKKADDEIHVGDEVYCLDSKHKYVVLGFLDNGKIFVFSSKGLTGTFAVDKVHKTGRNYPVKEILEGLKNGEE